MKTKHILLAMCLCFTCYQLKAETNSLNAYDPDKTTYDFTANGCYYNILSISDQTVELTCNWVNDNPVAAYSGDFRVPETVEYSNRTFTVTSIHPYAFYNSNFITLTIPATVQQMGYDFYAPGTCQNLVIEDSEEPLQNGGYLIGQVYNSVYIGRNFSQYGDIVDGYKDYDANLGFYRGGEYSTITFGNYVTELDRLCQNCQNLTSVTLPTSVRKLYGAFGGCKNLTTVSGAGVEFIKEALWGSGVTSLNMPNLRVMLGVFANNTTITSFVIPEGVILLGDDDKGDHHLFKNATALTSVYIPGTVFSFGEQCFAGCTSLQTISIANPNPISIKENNFDAMTYLNATLKVPVGSRTAYMNAPVWSNFLNIVEDASLVATSATIIVRNNYVRYGELTYTFSQEVMSYQENEWSDDIYYIVPIGTTMTITAQPNEGYALYSLSVNGEDVTEQVVNNEYTITINGSATYTIRADIEEDFTPIISGNYEDVTITYVDKDNEYLSSQEVTLRLPEAPEIEGFAFIGWQPVATIIDGAITIQAVYEANNPSSAPAVVTNPADPAQKLVREGNVYILHGEKTYTITGQEVR